MQPDYLKVIEVSGAVARAAGRPLDDNPHDPDARPTAHAAWARGWKSSTNQVENPVS